MKGLISLVGVTALVASAGATVTINIDPSITYLRTEGEPDSYAPAIDLAAYGLSSGDTLTLNSVGSFYYSTSTRDLATGMRGVFSSSDILLAGNLLNRVPGAISAGEDSVSWNTYVGNLPTDIPQDFWIPEGFWITGGVTLTIPTDARYLFVSAADNYFADNTPGPDGFGVTLTAVPEPATVIAGAVMLLPLGVSTLRKLRKNRA